MRPAVVVALCACALAAGAVQGQDDPPGFDWRVVDRLGGDRDGDGVIDGSLRLPLDTELGLELELRPIGSACRQGAEHSWQIDGAAARVRRVGPCQYTAALAGEGRHVVRLEVEAGGERTQVEQEVRSADHLVVSIGDSVASGEGNPDRPARFGRRARWLERRCHRSLLSGHAQAARAHERAGGLSALAFVPLGCSGATVPIGLLGPYRGIEPDGVQEPPQVDRLNALADEREVDAVLVSVGANDVMFSDIVQFCLRVGDCPRRRFDPQAPTLDDAVAQALERLAERYDELDARLSDRIPRDHVLIVEYFDPTRAPAGRFCRMFLGTITRAESEWAHANVLAPLNAVVAAAARRHGWRLVDGVGAAFDGHGLCARRRERWVTTPDESLFRQDSGNAFQRVAGTLHPDVDGHRATAALIRPQLAEVLREALPDPAPEEPDEDEGWGFWKLALVVAAAAAVLLAMAYGLVVALRRRRVY